MRLKCGATQQQTDKMRRFMSDLQAAVIATRNPDGSDAYWAYVIKCADALKHKYDAIEDPLIDAFVMAYVKGLSDVQINLSSQKRSPDDKM